MSFISACLRTIWRSRDGWVVLLLLGVSLCVNLYQALRAQRPLVTAVLARGMKVPRLYAQTVDGTKVEVDLTDDQKDTLLYIFSPSCVWCERNANNIEALAGARKIDYRVIGLSTVTAGLGGYLQERKI